MPLFRNFYTCYRCGYDWQDIWSATCDDDCPNCGARHVSPTESEDSEVPTDTQCNVN
jgi:rubrerythrin